MGVELPRDAGSSRRRPGAAVLLVVIVGAALTIGLGVVVESAHRRNEERLLVERTREAATVVRTALPGIITPLASVAELAEATGGDDTEVFRRLAGPYLVEERPFVSISIWRLDDPRPLATVGVEPILAGRPPQEIQQVLRRVGPSERVSVIGLLDDPTPRLGYVSAPAVEAHRFVAYGEAALPDDRRAVEPRETAFAGLDYAIYLGEREDAAQVLTANVQELPMRGRRAQEVIEFGDTELLLVMTPSTELGGSLMAALPWIVAFVTACATVATAVLVSGLTRRRREADRLARENERLYTEQRSVAKQLQQSLLPVRLPRFESFEVAVRYEPADEDLDIGGDWYDAIDMPDGRAMFVIGDVSGHGLQAATSMAAMRYGVRAYAGQGDRPAEVLTKLGALLEVTRDGHFATVLCVAIDPSSGALEIANAGHPPALLVDAAGARFVTSSVEPPIGVRAPRRSPRPDATSSIVMADGAVLLLYTDGLFERRRETIDVGLERLRRAATASVDDLDGLLDAILRTQRRERAHDDTALLGLRWHAPALTTTAPTTMHSTSP